MCGAETEGEWNQTYLPSDHNTLHLGTPDDLKLSRMQVKHLNATISKCVWGSATPTY